MPFGIGIEYPKTDINVAVLMRSAYNLGAAFIFTVGRKYKRLGADTPNTPQQIPVFNFKNWDDYAKTQQGWNLIGLEITDDAQDITSFSHPRNCIYVLGNESSGISEEGLKKCKHIVKVPSKQCMNVAMVGTIMMYDRLLKGAK